MKWRESVVGARGRLAEAPANQFDQPERPGREGQHRRRLGNWGRYGEVQKHGPLFGKGPREVRGVGEADGAELRLFARSGADRDITDESTEEVEVDLADPVTVGLARRERGTGPVDDKAKGIKLVRPAVKEA